MLWSIVHERWRRIAETVRFSWLWLRIVSEMEKEWSSWEQIGWKAVIYDERATTIQEEKNTR